MIVFSKKIKILVLLLVNFPAPSMAKDECEKEFDIEPRSIAAPHSNGETLTPTAKFIAYLSDLLQLQIIATAELTHFVGNLRQGVLTNPIESSRALQDVTAQIHREGIDSHLAQSDLDRGTLLAWAERHLSTRIHIEQSIKEVRQETSYPFRRMQFYPIPAGSFFVPVEDSIIKVKLSHNVEAMSTLVTQFHWVELMGENPAGFRHGGDQVTIDIKGKSVTLQPDHPAEDITWWSALEYANRLSTRYGYSPAYDFSRVVWKRGTRAENGTLDAESGEVLINAPGGDIYKAQGFRLPTEAEQVYLLMAGGQVTGKYYFDINEVKLRKHAWYQPHAGEKTHAVAQLEPLILQNGNFFDLLGNVGEWSWNWYSDDFIGGIDPTGPAQGDSRVFKGGSFIETDLGSDVRNFLPPGDRHEDIGLRLYRTLN